MNQRYWFWLFLLFPLFGWADGILEMTGSWTQGGIITGQTVPGTRLTLNGQPVRVSPDDGRFVFGFGRDAAAEHNLEIRWADGIKEVRILKVEQRRYETQRIDGLSPEQVTPPADSLERIRQEAAQVAEARNRDTPTPYFSSGFRWPLQGSISGEYGSQRILNGQPRQPHYGIDIVAAAGTPVQAPADGEVILAHPDMYFSGKTVILDHGYGLSSSFLHLEDIYVTPGQAVKQGDVIGTVGATGRVTGPHLDWRMNWFSQRVDPSTVVPPMNVEGLTIQFH